MDLFKRIKDLSAVYDDDGPSAMVPESRNTIAGGNIMGETIGDRTGFRKPKYVPTKNSFVVTDRTNKTVGTFKVEDYKNKTEAKKAANTLDKKMSAEAEERRIKTQEKNRTKFSADRTNYKKSINNWTQNWMDNNIKNYDLRDAETFIKDLKSDFKKEFNLKSPAKSLPSNIEGFPNIGTAAKSAKAAFTPYGITPLKRTGGEKATFAAYETFFRRAFLTNKIENDPVLKNRISNYLDYTTINKPGGSFALDKIKLKYADTLNNLDDVMYVLSDDTKVLNLAKKNLFGNIFPQYDKFRAKENSSMISRKNNISKIEKTLGPKKLKELLNGETSIDKFLINEGKALKKFFDVSELPGSLKYSIDHNIGISDISKLSKEEMERSLNSLIGMTVKRNKDLGWGGYSRTKQSLINKINQGKNVSKNLNKLNEITTAAYGPELKGKQAYNLVDGKLTFTEDFTFRTNPEERFKTYFTEIAKTPEGSAAIKKQMPSIEKTLGARQTQLIKDQFCTNKKGGLPGSCDISEAMDNMLKQTNAVKQGAIKGTEATRIANKASKVVRFGTGKGLGAVLGPIGLAGEAVFEVAMAVPGYARGESGKRLLGDSILGLIPGVGQSAEEEFAEYATKDGMSQLEQQKIKDANRFLELNNALSTASNVGVLEGRGAGRGGENQALKLFEKQYKEYEPLYNQFVGGPPSESASTALAEQQRINNLINADKAIRAEQRDIAMDEDFMAAGGGIAKMAGDRSGAMTRSMNPDSQGLSYLFNRVKKV
jgi:hypothetical protein